MTLHFTPLSTFGLDAAAAVMARGFEDYVVKLACTSAWLLHTARSDSVDLGASRVVVRGGEAVGAVLVARRGWTSRVAGMTLVPEARGQGIGRATMEHLIDSARQRGERAMVLEVIEGNTPAEKLYARCGFQRVRRLVSFARMPAPAGSDAIANARRLEQVDARLLANAVAQHGLADLPWQLSSETLAHLTPPSGAYRLDGAWIAVANLATPEPVVRALLTEVNGRRQGRGAAILRAMMALHPQKTWRVSALWPEELAGVFLAAGFSREPLSQWQMARALE